MKAMLQPGTNTPSKATGLDPAVLRDQLLELWNSKDLQSFRSVALQGFPELLQPLEDLLTILEGCSGKQKGRSNTVGSQIIMEFQSWLKEQPQVTLSSLPEQEALSLQHRALSLLTDTHPSFIENLINIYQLRSLDPSVLRLHIVKLQGLSYYKEAIVLSTKLKLQNEVNMEEICVPLILQDKLSMVESFVTGHRGLEEQLVTLLDSWCRPGFTVDDIRRRYPLLSQSKHYMGVIQPKVLTKHVLRLVERFNIDQGMCPNALHKRRLDTLRFLMYKRFGEKSMTEENWSDHVHFVVADDLELQVKLVELLVDHNNLEKASQMSLMYKIPRDRLPIGVWERQQSLPQSLQRDSESEEIEEWIPSELHCQKYYQAPLTKEKVHIVDTPEALQGCQDVVLKDGAVVGVDMEWQPTFGCSSAQQVALIQIAVQDHVFLLDLCASDFCQHPDTIGFVRSLFSKKDVLKLGYGMTGDLKCLLTTWQQLSEEPLKMEGVLDLLRVHQKIQTNKASGSQNGPKDVLVGEGSAEKGLSLLVQQVLGKPLDKTEQMSNWEKRPLRLSQIRYAVTDAFCLLEVYTAVSTNAAHFGLPADLRNISSHPSDKSGAGSTKEKQAKQKKQSQGKQECQGAHRVSLPHSDTEKGPLCGENPSENAPPLPPQQLRVVCDNMLQGLGRYLRCLGVDVVMLENTDDHRVAAKLAQAEGRVILTCGQPFQSLRSQVGEGRCLSLDCSEKARDQAVRVLRHFNIQLTSNDIFSRCQACNSDQYVAVPREDMQQMLRQKGFIQDQDQVNIVESPDHQNVEVEEPHASSDLPRYAPQCRWALLSELDPETLTFPGGAPIQLHTVHPSLLPRIPLFYVCTKCGKVFWEGSHFGRVLSMFQDVLQITDADTDSVTAVQQQ